jgi:hypothetical protein
MKMEKQSIELIVKTVNGKRLLFTEDGKQIENVIMTRETQNTDFAWRGKTELLVKLIVKCE